MLGLRYDTVKKSLSSVTLLLYSVIIIGSDSSSRPRITNANYSHGTIDGFIVNNTQHSHAIHSSLGHIAIAIHTTHSTGTIYLRNTPLHPNAQFSVAEHGHPP